MKLTLIYAYWPDQPFDVSWCDLPWALRNAGLPKALKDAGIDVLETFLRPEDASAEDLRSGFMLAKDIANEVAKAHDEGELPVVICGSTTLAALGAVAGLSGAKTGIAWFAAHPDLHTPDTTLSGLFEGMALAVATGQAWQTMARKLAGLVPADLKNVALFGVRDIDDAETEVIKSNDIPIVTSAEALNERLRDVTQVYVHLDMCVHDDSDVASNVFSISGGPSKQLLLETVPEIANVAAIAITGLDPAVEDADETCKIAIDYIKAIAAKWDEA